MRCRLSLLALCFHSLSLFAVSGALPHPDDKAPYPQEWQIKDLFTGNHRFVDHINVEYPGVLEQTGQKQQPPFMYIGCVDSR